MPKQKKNPHQTGGFPGQAPTSGNTQVEPTQKQFVNPEMEPLTGRDDNDDNAQQAVQQLQAQADESNVIFNPPSHNCQFICLLSPHPLQCIFELV